MNYRTRWQLRRRSETRRRAVATAAVLVCAGAVALVVALRHATATLWSHDLGRSICPRLSAAGETLYLAAPGGHADALRLSTGHPVWPSPHAAAMGFALAPVGTRYRVICVSDCGSISALDRHTGQVLWEVETGAAVRCTPLAMGGTVVVGDDAGTVLALDLNDGVEIWRFSAGAAISGGCALVGRTVVCGTADGRVLGLSAATGQRRWSVLLDGPVLAPVTAAGAKVVAASASGSIVLLDAAGGYVTATAPVPFAGTVRVRPLHLDGRVYVATAEGWLASYSASDLTPLWRTRLESGITGGPVILGGRVFCGDRTGRVVSLDATTGRGRRRWRTGASPVGSVVAVGDLVVVGLGDGRVVAYQAAR
jgi:outer membrane protein assembly factor BamB